MTFDEYQRIARTTAQYPNVGNNFLYPTLGLCGESGEVAEKIKKVVRDDAGIVSEERKQEIARELGDVLWYVSQIAAELGFSLDAVAAQNLEKLASRAARGKLSGSGDDR